MFSSNILDVAVGLVFVFLLLSLISSAANELIEAALKKRAEYLEKGIKELIGAPDSKVAQDFIKALYDHGLINSLYKGTYSSASDAGQLPSYIPARNFALAVLDLAKSGQSLPPNVEKSLGAFEKVAAGKAEALQQEVENWYNSSMDRVSGWYKRRTQTIVLVLGVVLTALVNADCIAIAKRLSTDSSLRQAAVQLAQGTAKQTLPTPQSGSDALHQFTDNVTKLDGIGLPLGWGGRRPWHQDFWMQVPGHLLGWLITALAVSLGAPFWFDVLNKFIVVRSTVKPAEKSGAEASKDGTKSQTPVVVNLSGGGTAPAAAVGNVVPPGDKAAPPVQVPAGGDGKPVAAG